MRISIIVYNSSNIFNIRQRARRREIKTARIHRARFAYSRDSLREERIITFQIFKRVVVHALDDNAVGTFGFVRRMDKGRSKWTFAQRRNARNKPIAHARPNIKDAVNIAGNIAACLARMFLCKSVWTGSVMITRRWSFLEKARPFISTLSYTHVSRAHFTNGYIHTRYITQYNIQYS